MHPNKIKVGQRVRAVLTETSGAVPLCDGVITDCDRGSAFVQYEDGWCRLYHKPTEELIAVEDEKKEPEKWDDLLREIERLREENAKLRKEYDDLQNRAMEALTQLDADYKKKIHKILADKALELACIRIENTFGGPK